ncbi:hypothetical protein Leryth_025736 [Lithospermum erythrorhizon]|nr:hypothetical protein Leryth_025736 [Lithospermum erythrorhizon]
MTHKNKLLRIEKKILEQKMYHLGWKSKIREVKIEKTKVEIMQIIELRNLGRQKIMNEPDLTLSLALPGIHAK